MGEGRVKILKKKFLTSFAKFVHAGMEPTRFYFNSFLLYCSFNRRLEKAGVYKSDIMPELESALA